MEVPYTPQQLTDFEDEIAACFNAGDIRAPIHLESGNEESLIRVFTEKVNGDDWVLTTWRSHLKCLLKGVPRDELKAAILAGQSIGLCFPKYRILSSAIVGGNLPIAVGIALGIKKAGGLNKVVCFLGDMTARCGMFLECLAYARNFDLPILWVIEDNGKSTNTPTEAAWGDGSGWGMGLWYRSDDHGNGWDDVVSYAYSSKWPHQGTGKFIHF